MITFAKLISMLHKNVQLFFNYSKSFTCVICTEKKFQVFSSSLILINRQQFTTKSFCIHLQVPPNNTIQYAPMAPTNSGAIPNTLGLSLETEHEHFKGDGKLVKIKCIAEVGSRKYETERMVHMAYVNNQRLSAGDMHAAARSIRTGLLAKLLTAILALVLLTT